MNKTSIEWTTFTSNPLKFRRKSDGKTVWSCVKVSPGCRFCYAEKIALRYDRGRLFNAANMEELEPFLDEKELHKMLRVKTIQGVPVSGSRCFVGDMTDIFGEWVSPILIRKLFEVFAERSDVTFQILTKRASRMAKVLAEFREEGDFASLTGTVVDWPLPNVWLGTSVENQKTADERLPHLVRTPAAVRFVSYEPALEEVDFTEHLKRERVDCPDRLPGCEVLHLGPQHIHWLICGGESGPGARPFDVAWARSALEQCRAAGTAFFMKQMGSRPFDGLWTQRGFVYPTEFNHLKLKHPKGSDINEFPEDLRVRGWPK